MGTAEDIFFLWKMIMLFTRTFRSLTAFQTGHFCCTWGFVMDGPKQQVFKSLYPLSACYLLVALVYHTARCQHATCTESITFFPSITRFSFATCVYFDITYSLWSNFVGDLGEIPGIAEKQQLSPGLWFTKDSVAGSNPVDLLVRCIVLVQAGNFPYFFLRSISTDLTMQCS